MAGKKKIPKPAKKNPSPVKKKPFGRPTSYKPEYCIEIVELSKLGKSIAQIADKWDVSKQSVYEWCGVHEDFSEAFTRARTAHECWYITQIVNGFIENKDNRYNANLVKWYGFVHYGYTEKREPPADIANFVGSISERIAATVEAYKNKKINTAQYEGTIRALEAEGRIVQSLSMDGRLAQIEERLGIKKSE